MLNFINQICSRMVRSKFNMYHNGRRELLVNAKSLRISSTEAEKVLWQEIRSKKLGVKFRRQHVIENFIVDFYCHEFKLAIEVDGDYHLEAEQQEYDENRSYNLNEYGVVVLRFSNDEVLYDINKVKSKIIDKITELKKEDKTMCNV